MRLEELQQAHPEAEVQLWAEDEARRGLKPVIRRVWAPVGKRPVARFKRSYKWTYLYGFVHPESGEVYWLILPTVNTKLFSMALSEFAREVGAGKDKRVLLVVDRAGWHTGKEVELPEGIHLEFLPSGSPELQPAEIQSRATAAVQDWPSEPNGSPVKGSKYSAKPPVES